MNNTNITSEKRIKIVIGVFAVAVSILILHFASLMSVLPNFLKARIAHAPTPQWITLKQNLIEAMKQ